MRDSRPNTADQRPCLDCLQTVYRDHRHRMRWKHPEPTNHPARPAPREYDPPCKCGLATIHLAEPGCD